MLVHGMVYMASILLANLNQNFVFSSDKSSEPVWQHISQPKGS
jgi:hypothetical protein